MEYPKNAENGATAKKSLMNAVEKLNSVTGRAGELVRYSEKMVAKFERTEGIEKGTSPDGIDAKTPSPQGIIDLLEGICSSLENSIDKIGSNVDRVINMIE